MRVAELRDAAAWAATWKEPLAARGEESPDGDWDWHAEIARALREDGFQCLAAASPDRLEGLMSLSLGTSRLRHGRKTVYVEYVGTAPWNQASLGPRAEIRGIGTELVKQAVRVSVDLGFQGRIGLHSKPAAEAFYRERLGLVDVGLEVTTDGSWVYFEATPNVARKLLQP